MGGSNISRMTPSRGFCVEIMAAITVLIFSMGDMIPWIGAVPVSTTHCQVGALIGAGLVRGWVDSGTLAGAKAAVNFKLMRGILLSWVATVPFALALSALIYVILKAGILIV